MKGLNRQRIGRNGDRWWRPHVPPTLSNTQLSNFPWTVIPSFDELRCSLTIGKLKKTFALLSNNRLNTKISTHQAIE